MLATNIEREVREILERKGKDGWLRTTKCAKFYGRGDKSRETYFYRWRKKVQKSKVAGFKVLKLPDNVSFIGLKSADERAINALASEDKELKKSVESGVGFFEWLENRSGRKQQEREIGEKRSAKRLKDLEREDTEETAKMMQPEGDIKP